MRFEIGLVLAAVSSLFVAACGEDDASTGAMDAATTEDVGDAPTTDADSCWWCVDADPNLSPDEGSAGGDGKGGKDGSDVDQDCYDGCVNSGKPNTTPEFCEAFCAKGGKDGGGKDGGGELDPDCYDACIDKGRTPDVCEEACTDAGGKDGGKDGGGNTSGDEDDSCYDECIATGKPEATPEVCKEYCDARAGKDP